MTRSWPCKHKPPGNDFYKISFCLRNYLNIRTFPYANLPLKHMTPKSWSPHCIHFTNNKCYGQFFDTIFDNTSNIFWNIGKNHLEETVGKLNNGRVANFYNRLQLAKYKLFSWWFGLYNEGYTSIVLLYKNNCSCIEIEYISVSFLNSKLIQV